MSTTEAAIMSEYTNLSRQLSRCKSASDIRPLTRRLAELRTAMSAQYRKMARESRRLI